MNKTEIAEIVRDTDMYALACKTNKDVVLDEDEKAVVAQLDAHFKKIGETGNDPDHEIAAFVTRVINEELENAPDELLDALFDRGTIGEADDYQLTVEPENTLVAYEAAKGGNVEKSYLDIRTVAPTWKNRQIESEISYADLRRNGWKTVARITEYATEAFRNYMFADIFAAIDAAIVSGADNYISVGATLPTQAAMDQISLYVNDRAPIGDGNIIALSKYIQAASKLTGFVSQDMINEVNRRGSLGVYDGVALNGISAAKKLTLKDAAGTAYPMFPDKRIFGIAGKIGTLTQKGEVNIYEDMHNNTEVVHLMFKDFTYGYAFSNSALDNVVKAVLN